MKIKSLMELRKRQLQREFRLFEELEKYKEEKAYEYSTTSTKSRKV